MMQGWHPLRGSKTQVQNRSLENGRLSHGVLAPQSQSGKKTSEKEKSSKQNDREGDNHVLSQAQNRYFAPGWQKLSISGVISLRGTFRGAGWTTLV